jgi:aspartate/methionine/tyrosine aminotransferase
MICGLYGYGTFGQFLHKYLQKFYNEIIISSIEQNNEELFFNSNMDIIIFCNSINSFEEVISKILKINPLFFNNKLIVDVLSVKEYPLEIYNKYNITDNILLTHPMFGPNSVNENDLWNDKKFIYHEINIKETDIYNNFMDFLKSTKCNLIKMDPTTHDKYVAESQFITHFIGKSLKELDLKDTPINTLNYDNFLKLINNIGSDSFELFKGMTIKNKYTKQIINNIIYNIFKTKDMLYPVQNVHSATSLIMDKIKNLEREHKYVINSAIGIPTWGPNINGSIDVPSQNNEDKDEYGIGFSNEYSQSGGNLDLKEKLVEYFDYKITTDNILITNGGKPALYYAICAYTNVGSSWLLPSPYWVSYPDMIKLVNGNTIIIETTIENKWLFDLNIVEEHFKDEKVNGIIICNPCNPTGIIYPKTFLFQLVQLVNKYNKKIIVDEVYMPLLCDYKYSLFIDHRYDNIKTNNNIIAIWSFSKGWGLAGWRLGFILAEPPTIKKLTGIQSTINTCPSTASQQVAIGILQNNYFPIDKFKLLCQHKNSLIKLYKKKGWKIIDHDFQTSMYIFPVNYNININEYIDKLLSKGLAVISGESFGCKYGIRITLCSDYDSCDKTYKIIDECT